MSTKEFTKKPEQEMNNDLDKKKAELNEEELKDVTGGASIDTQLPTKPTKVTFS